MQESFNKKTYEPKKEEAEQITAEDSSAGDIEIPLTEDQLEDLRNAIKMVREGNIT